ncbi:hypothetical protein [Azohydromonas aeria]|uniref:hypothetical protein n=1 Tax=Azohydromonas aeria TaxID=2590212 RepID=UPI0012FCF4D5|nr:hypothetical protein [Azohydromonas aeria]
MADIEQRAARGELTIAQAKQEIFALRERFGASPDRVTRWAAQQAQGENSEAADKPEESDGAKPPGGQSSRRASIEEPDLAP